MTDEVNSPSHYKQPASPLLAEVRGALLTEDFDSEQMQCFDAMINMLGTVEEIRGYLRGNSFKYRWRYLGKAGVQSLMKAKWYEKKLEKLEEIVENHSHQTDAKSLADLLQNPLTPKGEAQKRREKSFEDLVQDYQQGLPPFSASKYTETTYEGKFCEPSPEENSYIEMAKQGYDYLADEFGYPAPAERSAERTADQGVSS